MRVPGDELIKVDRVMLHGLDASIVQLDASHQIFGGGVETRR